MRACVLAAADKMYADATNTAVEGLAAIRTVSAFKSVCSRAAGGKGKGQ